MNFSINLLKDDHTNLAEPSDIDWYKIVYNGTYQGDILNDEKVTSKNEAWKMYLNKFDNLNSVYKEINEKASDSNIDNVETKIIDEDIAYLKIKSFMKFTNEDMEKIKNLYKDINNYNNYIIDIRGNGGGDSLLWREHIVKPIVNDIYESTTYALHKDGKITNDYYSSNDINLKDIKKFPNKDMLKKAKNIDDYKYYSEYNLKFTNESIWEGEKNKNAYNGNIYLLVDKGSFSSSEGFAVFCKNSGLVIRSTAQKGLNKDASSNIEEGTSLDLYMNSLDDLIEHINI